MRRPVTAIAVLFVFAVWLAVTLDPPVYDVNPKADGRYVTLTGTVDWKEYAADSNGEDPYLKMTLSSVAVEDGIPTEAGFEVHRDDKVLCEISDETSKQADWAGEGVKVRVKGKIRLYRSPSNDGEFNEFMYYNCIKGFLFTLGDVHILSYTKDTNAIRASLFALRNYLSSVIDSLYRGKHGKRGERCASALKAMLLGQSSLLDRNVKEAFQGAGIIHVICISGLHISLIGMGIFRALRKAGAPTLICSGFAFLFIFMYGVMTGMQISCVRALVMFGFQMAARALGRTFDMITALSCAAVFLLIEQPCYLFNSGFLFSFAAVTAAGLISPQLSRLERPFVIPLFTLPVQICFYYSFPLYSVLLNLLVLTLAPFILAGGCAAAAIFMLSALPFLSFAGPVASAAAEIPYVVFSIYEFLCELSERLPFYNVITGRPPALCILLYYALLCAAAAAACRRSKSVIGTTILQITAVAAALVILLAVRFEPPLSLYMLDVGQGDGLCIRAQDENGTFNVLIDGGSTSKKNTGKYIMIPFLKYHGISRIDCCIVSHDDLDHCSAVLELLEQTDEPAGLRVDSIALPSVSKDCKGDTYKKIESLASEKGIELISLHRGMILERGELKLECIHPGDNCSYSDANAYSAVMLMTYGKFSALFTGDLEGEGESDLIAYLGKRRLDVSVLKTAHHGSESATTEEFLRKVSAQTALISYGVNNYGHPSPVTVRRLLKAGMRIFGTRTSGQIRITTDGRGRYSVETKRNISQSEWSEKASGQ